MIYLRWDWTIDAEHFLDGIVTILSIIGQDATDEIQLWIDMCFDGSNECFGTIVRELDPRKTCLSVDVRR